MEEGISKIGDPRIKGLWNGVYRKWKYLKEKKQLRKFSLLFNQDAASFKRDHSGCPLLQNCPRGCAYVSANSYHQRRRGYRYRSIIFTRF